MLAVAPHLLVVKVLVLQTLQVLLWKQRTQAGYLDLSIQLCMLEDVPEGGSGGKDLSAAAGPWDGQMFYEEDSLGVVVVDPEEEVAAVVTGRARRRGLCQTGGEVVVVQSSVEVEDVHGGWVAVHHRPGHGQQVLLHTPPQAAHLHTYMRLTPGSATSAGEPWSCTYAFSPPSSLERTNSRLLQAPLPLPFPVWTPPSSGATHCEC